MNWASTPTSPELTRSNDARTPTIDRSLDQQNLDIFDTVAAQRPDRFSIN